MYVYTYYDLQREAIRVVFCVPGPMFTVRVYFNDPWCTKFFTLLLPINFGIGLQKKNPPPLQKKDEKYTMYLYTYPKVRVPVPLQYY